MPSSPTPDDVRTLAERLDSGRGLVFVHDWLTGMRGGEKCLEALAEALPHASVLTLLHRRGSTCPTIERLPIRTSLLGRLPGVHRYYRSLLPFMPTAIERLRVPQDTRLVLSLSHAVAQGIGVPDGVPHVSYCFTPVRYAWHLRSEYLKAERGLKGWLNVPLRAVQGRVLDRLRDWDRHAAERVSEHVAISQTIADRIRECYGRTSRIVAPPVDTDFYCAADVERDTYYLCVSALVPYKRVDLAVEACTRLGRRLVVIGQGPELGRLRRLAGPSVTLLGWQTDEVIRDHYRRAGALLFPGEEDFGIVPLEAQGCGLPVLAYNAGGATETIRPPNSLQPGTGMFFDERSVDCLAAAMLRFETERDSISPTLCRQQAERFSRVRFQHGLLAILVEHAEGTLNRQPVAIETRLSA